ncbi:hypothetical protein [Streptomyces sp. NPDC086989]|uniref:hypothetical protein n=1 Tax=Streptomyces sp. NPDC086989 TaxID=3365764 RepID=UPI00382DCE32
MRTAVRRRAVDWWSSTHPDDPPPQRTSEVADLWYGERIAAFEALTERRTEQLGAHADARARGVDALEDLSPEDAAAVRRAVRSAHWSTRSRASWAMVVDEIRYTYPGFVLPALFVTCALPMWIIWPWVFAISDFTGFPATGVITIGLLCALLLFVHRLALAAARRIAPWAEALWRLVAAACAVGLTLRQEWRPWILEWATTPQSAYQDLPLDNAAHADVCTLYALKAFAVVVVWRLVTSAAGAVPSRMGPREPAGALASSLILLELFDLALLARSAAAQSAPEGEEGFRPYLASPDRLRILGGLERLAALAEGRWKRSLRTGDGAADAAVFALCDGVAAAARAWKAKAASGEGLDEMSHAFTLGLVDAAHGNWGNLAIEVSEKELTRRRVARGLRQVTGILFILGSAWAILADPLSWFGKSPNPAVETFLFLLVGLVATTIDPTLVDRFGNAAKLSGHFGARSK